MNQRRGFNLQFHITNSCEKNCMHCYMTSEQRNNSQDMSFSEITRVVDDLWQFSGVANMQSRISWTGGNPFMRRDFYDLLVYSMERGIVNHVMGNPGSIDEESARRLKKSGVYSFQLSLDGLEKTHDELRGEGSFKQVLNAIPYLKNQGIDVAIMSTVTKKNQQEMPDLVKRMIGEGVDKFDFARLVPIGNGKELEELIFSAQDYKAFLNEMYNSYHFLIGQGHSEEKFGTKDPLWALLLSEKNEYIFPKKDGLIYTGCSLGKNGLCLDADGSIYACRRMPESIGNIKTTTIRDAFIHNRKMNEYRELQKIEGCNECDLFQVCRGCRAVAWAKGGYFTKDPQCWRV